MEGYIPPADNDAAPGNESTKMEKTTPTQTTARSRIWRDAAPWAEHEDYWNLRRIRPSRQQTSFLPVSDNIHSCRCRYCKVDVC